MNARAGTAVFVIAVAAFPFAVRSHTALSVGVFTAIAAMVGVGLALLMGYGGAVSLGQSLFYGIGAYTVAILTTRYGCSPWLAFVAAPILAGSLGWVVGFVLTSLRGHVMALATLGFAVIGFVLFNETATLTGGPSGITAVPSPALGPLSFGNDTFAFYAAWALVVLMMLGFWNLLQARFGRTLTAIGDSDEAAAACGVHVGAERAKVFALAAAGAGIAGAVYAFYTGFVNPSPFDLESDIAFVSMVMLGGVTSAWGAVLGAAFITIFPQVLGAAFSGANITGVQTIVYGVLLLLVIIFLPQGIVPSLARLIGVRPQRRTSYGSAVTRHEPQQIV